MGTAETMVILPQVLACYSLPAKSKLVNTSTSDNELKPTVRRCVLQNVTSNSLTELRSLRCDGKLRMVVPSIDRGIKEKTIIKVPSQTDMWECIRTHYQYLMEDDLIATCKKTREELSWMYSDAAPYSSTSKCWTCTDFIRKFNEMHDSLHALHTTCAREVDKTQFVQSYQNSLRTLWNEWQVYKEQATILENKYPCMKDDISRRCNILSNKWEALELSIWPKKQEQRESLSQKVLGQMKHVRRWLSEVDSRLTGLMVSSRWTPEEKRTAYNNQKALQQEIETRGSEVTSLVHQVELLGTATLADDRLTRAVRNLERSWHNLWLRSLENLCVTELLLKEQEDSLKSKPVLESSDGESDEGPRKKPRRLIYDCGTRWLAPKTIGMEPHSMLFEDPESKKTADPTKPDLKQMSKGTRMVERTRDVGIHCVAPLRDNMPTNDKCIMVGTTGIAALKAKYGDDFSNFEIIQDVGYSSESSTHLSSDDVSDNARNYSYSPPRRDVNSFSLASSLSLRKDLTKVSEFSVAQQGFGYNSLGSTSSASHNDSGFGTIDSSSALYESERHNRADYCRNEAEPSEWLVGETFSDGAEAEDVAEFCLSFPDFIDDVHTDESVTLGKPVERISEGFDSDASMDDYCNRSSLTSDAQVYYKMTSVDSESGECDLAEDAITGRDIRKKKLSISNNHNAPLSSSKRDSLPPVCESTDEEELENDKSEVKRSSHSMSTDDEMKLSVAGLGPKEPKGTTNQSVESEDSEILDGFFGDELPQPLYSSSPITHSLARDAARNYSGLMSRQSYYSTRLKTRRSLPEKSVSDSGLDRHLGLKQSRNRHINEWLSRGGGGDRSKTRCICNRRRETLEEGFHHHQYCRCQQLEVDSSGDASGEYTTNESDGNGFLSSSSEDNGESYYTCGRRRLKTFCAFTSLDYALFDACVATKSSVVETLLLPPPPPPTPPKDATSAADSDRSAIFDVESFADDQLRCCTARNSRLRMNSSSGSSNSLTAKESVVDRGTARRTSLIGNSGYTSSDSSSIENPNHASAFSPCYDDNNNAGFAGNELSVTRSLPSVFLSDSFQSSTSEHCHSYPANNAKCFPSDLLKKKARNKRRRKKRPSGSSYRSLRRQQPQQQHQQQNCFAAAAAVGDAAASTRKRHWSQADDRSSTIRRESVRGMTQEITGNDDGERAQVLSSPISDGPLGNVEEQSTVSDQVWDGYQEPPYLSEAYSEPTVDEEAVRKLTEFGDDYGSMIGQSLRFPSDAPRRPLRMRHSTKESKIPSSIALKSNGPVDSDSDAEDLYDILEDTFKALQFARSTFLYKTGLCESDYAELLATCQTHLRCLRAIEQHIQADAHKNHFVEMDLENLNVLIKEWAMLQDKIEASQGCSVEGDILTLRRKLLTFAVVKKFTPEDILSQDDLKKKMEMTEMALATLSDIRDGELIGVNVRVHRIITDTGCSNSPLKDDIAKLYLLWEQVYDQNSQNLSVLQCVESRHNEYKDRYQQLRSKLAGYEDCCDDSTAGVVVGSLCKEFKELKRDAKRWFGRDFLGALKDDLLDLENKLFDEHRADSESFQHSDDSKWSSRSSCHPRFDAEAKIAEDDIFRGDDVVDHQTADEQQQQKKKNVVEGNGNNGSATDKDDPKKKESSGTPSRIWRVFRAALPFQVAFALLCCLACVLEPHCCDFLNTLNFSLMPQLRHLRGPPPV